jgi:GT2 family glycosyltransferase
MYGNNTLVRKAAVAKVGWYDESHRTNGEDMDMSRRLMSAGYACVYQPRAVVGHLRQDSLRSILDTYWRWWKFGTGAHVKDITLTGMLVDIGGGHILRSLKRVLWRDLRRGNWELLGIDVLLPVYMISRYLDLIFGRMKQKHIAARIR